VYNKKLVAGYMSFFTWKASSPFERKNKDQKKEGTG
jgi:hypothetical protein